VALVILYRSIQIGVGGCVGDHTVEVGDLEPQSVAADLELMATSAPQD
jgi:hypothetical protein